MNSRIHLVIVDDHEMLRKTWRMVLEHDRRIEIIAECSSGAEAIACAARDNPDVMLMDVGMKPMNGFEAAQKIFSQFPAIKIIGMSISNQPAYARNMLQAGAKGFVTKNSSSEEMVTAIITVHNGETYICREIADKMSGNSRD